MKEVRCTRLQLQRAEAEAVIGGGGGGGGGGGRGVVGGALLLGSSSGSLLSVFQPPKAGLSSGYVVVKLSAAHRLSICDSVSRVLRSSVLHQS